jgi:hypothetical protein
MRLFNSVLASVWDLPNKYINLKAYSLNPPLMQLMGLMNAEV